MRIHSFAFLIWSFSIASTALAQNKWEDLAGNYFLDSAGVKGLDNFMYFSLEPSDYWKNLDTSRSAVRYFPSDSVEHGESSECPMLSIFIQDDSIYFSTSFCGQERFAFAGRFTVPASQFQYHSGEAVLEGVLTYFKRAFPVTSAKVSFRYEDFGD